MCHHADRRLIRRPESIADARRFVVEQLAAWGLDEHDPGHAVLDDAVLVVSELVTNAVKFSSGDLLVAVTAHHDYVEVAVMDDSPEPARRVSPELGDVGGRGMLLVELLSRDWGQDRITTEGKSVWARLPLASGSVLTGACDPAPEGG